MNFRTILKYCIFIFTFYFIQLSAQTDSIEVYLIDAYATPEIPHVFKLSFFTSDLAKSKVILDERYTYDVSNELTDMHKTNIDLTGLKFDGNIVNFIILTEDADGNIFKSELFDFDLPFEPEIVEESNFLQLCLFGGTVFLLPYPGYAFFDGSSSFSLTKEIPIISFRSKSLKYPAGFLSLEYTYIFDVPAKNYLRAGYKKIFELPHIEYLSPGISLYTNFLGNNGISPEVSAGLFSFSETFTVYFRYRYNIKLGGSSGNFQEVSIGLYSAFFSFYLD